MLRLKVSLVKLDKELPTPRYSHHGDAGMDIYSRESVVLQPGEIKLIPTGIALEIPEGYEVQIRPRSGLALKHGLGMVNSPGTIDHGYRGEVGVIAINHGKQPLALKRGERIAQMIFNKIECVDLIEVDALSPSSRGAGGFGSTGR